MYWKRSTWPVSSLNRASSSRVGPKTLWAALRIAASIVSIRIFLSIPFSFATCSRMPPRLVSVLGIAAIVAMTPSLLLSPALNLSLALRLLLRLRRELEDQVRVRDIREGRIDALAVDDERDHVRRRLDERAADHHLAVGRRPGKLDLGQLPCKTLKISGRAQPPLEAGG